MKRLFFALWPDEPVRSQCARVIQHLDNGEGRPVLPENVHITLLFLGQISADKEMRLKQDVADLYVPEINIRFNRISYWKKPGILCLTADEKNLALMQLVEGLVATAKKHAIPLDDCPFEPHVTLFRKVNGVAALEFDTIDWRSSSFCLVESSSQHNKVEYRILACWGSDGSINSTD